MDISPNDSKCLIGIPSVKNFDSFLIFAEGYTEYTSSELSKISVKAQEPAERPAPKSRKDFGLNPGYLYFISVIILTAVAKLLGALFSK